MPTHPVRPNRFDPTTSPDAADATPGADVTAPTDGDPSDDDHDANGDVGEDVTDVGVHATETAGVGAETNAGADGTERTPATFTDLEALLQHAFGAESRMGFDLFVLGTGFIRKGSKSDFVIPMVAALGATLSVALASAPSRPPEEDDDARVGHEMMNELAAKIRQDYVGQDHWRTTPAAYGEIAAMAGGTARDLVRVAPPGIARAIIGADDLLNDKSVADRFAQFLRRTSVELPHAVLLAQSLAHAQCGKLPAPFALLHHRAARISKALVQHAATHGVRDWPSALDITHAAWDAAAMLRWTCIVTGATRDAQRLLQETVASTTAESQQAQLALAVAEQSRVALARQIATRTSAAERLLADAETRIAALQDALRREREAARLATSRAHRAQRRADWLSEQAATAGDSVPAPEDGDETPRSDAPDDASDPLLAPFHRTGPEAELLAAAATLPAPPPSDVFAGRAVYLFTNQARGGVRAEMAASFTAMGAHVREYLPTSKRLGPDRYPDGAIVVIDTSFMAHKISERLRARARRDEVFCFEGRFGTGGLARAAADAFAQWALHRGLPSGSS